MKNKKERSYVFVNFCLQNMTFPMSYRKVKSEKKFFCPICPMTPVVWSVKCTSGGKIMGSDPNLTFCVLIILLAKFHACALKWSEKKHMQTSLCSFAEVFTFFKGFKLCRCFIWRLKTFCFTFFSIYCKTSTLNIELSSWV